MIKADATNEQAIMARAMLRSAMRNASDRTGVAVDLLFKAAIDDLPQLAKLLRVPVEFRAPVFHALVAVGVSIPRSTWARFGIEHCYQEPKPRAALDLFVERFTNVEERQ